MSQQDDEDFKRIAPYVQRNLELEQQVTELTNKLSAAELTAIRVSANLGEAKMQLRNVDAMLAKERQAGRDEYQKELSEQEPIAIIRPNKLSYPGLFYYSPCGYSEHLTDKPDVPLIIRPQPPKEQY